MAGKLFMAAILVSLLAVLGCQAAPVTQAPVVDKQASLLVAYHGPRVCQAVDGLAAKYKAPKRQETVKAILTQSILWNVDPLFVASVVAAESEFQPGAVSRCGARGLMQLLPSTARGLGVVNIHDVQENVRGGVRQLAYLSSRFGRHEYVLAGYNAGPARARGPWPEETRHYVPKVLRIYRGLRQAAGKVEGKPAGVYIVQSGDTLSRIAKRFGATVERLARRNRIGNVNLIHTGQRLVIA